MRIKYFFALAAVFMAQAQPTLAAESTHKNHAEAHDGQIFHAMKFEAGVGSRGDGTLSTWDLDGWIGGDINKLWLKSEGELLDGNTPEKAEYWAMYSRNIATFWDGQIGIRYDEQPNSTAYFVAGFEGLAPHLFETKAHFFVSD